MNKQSTLKNRIAEIGDNSPSAGHFLPIIDGLANAKRQIFIAWRARSAFVLISAGRQLPEAVRPPDDVLVARGSSFATRLAA